MKIEIDVPPMLFQFDSLQQWICRAPRFFEKSGYRGEETICVDAAGRLCRRGSEFMRADREGTYPIKVYPHVIPVEEPPAPAEAALGDPEADFDEDLETIEKAP